MARLDNVGFVGAPARDISPPSTANTNLSIATNFLVVGAALLAEALLGYPAWLYRAIRHPVVWIGALLARLDRTLNRPPASAPVRRACGVLTLLLLVTASVVPASLAECAAFAWLPQFVAILLTALLASTLLAQRSLYAHVRAVADGLDRGGLGAGRGAVAKIVGRNPNALDEAGVVRAAIESLAENFSDGVVAPALWCGLLGLGGIAAYKAVNTADSMIGHRTPRHAAFGWAAARLDDVVNLPASRLAAFFFLLAAFLLRGASPTEAWRAVRRDAKKHRSPNAGWPEAAMAGALGLRLAGPRVYGTIRVEDAWMGGGRAEATVADLRRALRLFQIACLIEFLVASLLAVIARG